MFGEERWKGHWAQTPKRYWYSGSQLDDDPPDPDLDPDPLDLDLDDLPDPPLDLDLDLLVLLLLLLLLDRLSSCSVLCRWTLVFCFGRVLDSAMDWVIKSNASKTTTTLFDFISL